MRRLSIAVMLCLGCAFVGLPTAWGQSNLAGKWATPGGNAQLTGWQNQEGRITRENAKGIQLLWKLKLHTGAEAMPVPTEPLIAGRLITEKGFKDEALILGPGDNLYAVDFELGQLMWRKHFDVQDDPVQNCPNGQFSAFVIQPLPTFHFRPPTPGKPFQSPKPKPTVGARRIGSVGGGGFFRMRGVYVLTSDGYLHEQILTNGEDFAPAVKFLSARDGDLSDLSANGSTLYVNTTDRCGGKMQTGGTWAPESNGTWALDMSTDAYTLKSYRTGGMDVAGLAGPARSPDGRTLYVSTGAEAATAASASHPNGLVALDAKSLAVKDYYTPSGADAMAKTDPDVSPVVFKYKGRDLVAAYGAGSRLVLLDSASLGGADHHTPLAITEPLARNGGSGAWGRLATALDKNGARWIFVSIRGPRAAGITFPVTNGATPNGSLVAFKVEERGGKTVLAPGWVSPNVVNPSPAVIASGLVFTLANGEAGQSPAKLLALDAETGKPVYSSGNKITSPAYFASLSLSLGHVLFVTADNTLYSFGIGIEH